jgi:hypothetical protein
MRARRVFDAAKRVRKFAHFRAFGLVRREKTTGRRNAESDTFTCRRACAMRVVANVVRTPGNGLRDVLSKKNR